MPRKKIENRDEILAHNLIVRVNNKLLKRLEDLHQNSNCQSVAEVARRILEKERITIFHKDISMNGVMEELTGIRKELKAIAIISTRLPERSTAVIQKHSRLTTP